MSFIIDTFLLIGCGALVVYISVRFLLKRFQFRHWIPLLAVMVLMVFWLIAGALYLDIIDFPFLGDAGRGNHFMWNSGCELIGLKAFVDASVPTYTDLFGAMNVFAIFLFALYPLWLYIGILIGYFLFGRTEKQTGIVGLL